MEWSIQQIARLSGTTSRTLRHYDEQGLLPPTRIGANGYRYYDEAALVRLQRILLLRQLGLGLPAIAELLDGQTDDVAALTTHRALLEQERDRVERLIATVTTTIERLEGGQELMAEEVFDGFDHTQYREEVEQRWGADAYARSDRWWRGLGSEGQAAFREEAGAITTALAAAHAAGASPDAPEVQALMARHYAWVRAGWGGTAPSAEAFVGLGEMYVADPRFAQHYGGAEGAAFVRDAMRAYAASELG